MKVYIGRRGDIGNNQEYDCEFVSGVNVKFGYLAPYLDGVMLKIDNDYEVDTTNPDHILIVSKEATDALPREGQETG